MLNSATDMMLTLLNIRTLDIGTAESIYQQQGKLLYAFMPAISNLLHVCSGKCWKLATLQTRFKVNLQV